MNRICLVKNILAEQGRTQRWLARRINMDETLVSRILNGHRPPNAAFISAVCRELALPESMLFPFASESPRGNTQLTKGKAA